MNLNDQPLAASRSESRRRKFTWKKFFLLMFIAVFLSGTAYTGYLYYKLDELIGKTGTEEKVKPAESASVKPVTLLLLGLDSRKEIGTLNTDVIMIASLNPKNKTATVVSVPRDTYMEPSGYGGNKANVFFAMQRKKDDSEAYAEIKKIYGEYLDVPIDYVGVVDFHAFEEVVDDLGGISVDVDMDMRYIDTADGTEIDLKKGYQTLNGKQALDFVRYRKSNRGTAPSSDFQRNERQQKVIAALIDKLKSISTLPKVGDVLDSLGDHVKTDIPQEQIKDLIKTYAGIAHENIKYIHLEGPWHSPYINVNPESLLEAQTALKSQLTMNPGTINEPSVEDRAENSYTDIQP